jgi:hypothetical protein
MTLFQNKTGIVTPFQQLNKDAAKQKLSTIGHNQYIYFYENKSIAMQWMAIALV